MTDSISSSEQNDQESKPLFGIVAEYDTPTEIVRASKKVRDAGYSRWDTFTPFPVHGIDQAMGIKMTKLPWMVIVMAMVGLATAIWLQWWTNAVDYPWLISGKPFWSWPANVPIMFELTVLFSALTTLAGMLTLNNLPLFSHPLDVYERFRRVSDDKFFLVIEARDAKFDEVESRKLLEGTSPASLETVRDERPSSDHLPRPLVYGLIIAVVASLIPFAFFAKARASTMREGRIHVVWDMDFGPGYKAQSENPLYRDKRSMRQPEQGTVARGFLHADDHLYKGRDEAEAWATTLPEGVEATTDTMKLGKQQFEIYCTPCHGDLGDGQGMIHKRASLLGGGWVPPSNLLDQRIKEMPAGEIFNTITHGIRNMKGYGSQIEADERWAIILYLRALQNSRMLPASELSDADRAQLK